MGNPWKTNHLIQSQSMEQTRVDPRNVVLDGAYYPEHKGALLRYLRMSPMRIPGSAPEADAFVATKGDKMRRRVLSPNYFGHLSS